MNSKRTPNRNTLTLAPVKFKDAIAAALETPPERKKPKRGRPKAK